MRLTRISLAAAALLLLGAACDIDPKIEPQLTVSGTGTVAGQLYFDANSNNTFDPVGGDTLLKGVPIQVRARGGSQVLASTTTDANGSFTLANLPAGSHDLFAVASTDVTGTLVFCINPSRATVFVGEQTFLSVAAKRGCVVRINVAETQPANSVVTVAGIVTVTQGAHSNAVVYVQDPTGGIQLNLATSSQGFALQAGDSVEVNGTLAAQSTTTASELRLNNANIVSVKRGATPIAPQVVTLAELAAATPNSPLIGRLITLRKIQVGTFDANRNAPITFNGGSAGALLRAETNQATTITQANFAAGKCYDVTGISAFFGSPEIKPLAPSSIVEVPCT